VTHFVAGAGTGGTICGVAKFLKEQNPAIRIVAADPEGSVYSGGEGRPYLTEGVGEDFWPANYDPSLVDEVIAVSDADASTWPDASPTKKGCSLAVQAGPRSWRRFASRKRRPRIVRRGTGADTGRGYISKIFNDDWMRGYGFLNHGKRSNAGGHPRRQGCERDGPHLGDDRQACAR